MRDGWDNFKNSPEPFMVKLRLALRNSWMKVRERRRCCGNHGEPAC